MTARLDARPPAAFRLCFRRHNEATSRRQARIGLEADMWLRIASSDTWNELEDHAAENQAQEVTDKAGGMQRLGIHLSPETRLVGSTARRLQSGCGGSRVFVNQGTKCGGGFQRGSWIRPLNRRPFDGSVCMEE